ETLPILGKGQGEPQALARQRLGKVQILEIRAARAVRRREHAPGIRGWLRRESLLGREHLLGGFVELPRDLKRRSLSREADRPLKPELIRDEALRQVGDLLLAGGAAHELLKRHERLGIVVLDLEED